MKITYTGRKANLSERERAKLERKLDKIQRILTRRGRLGAHVTLTRQRHLCHAEVTLRALRHTLVVEAAAMSAFAAMRIAVDKLEKQALRNKRRIVDLHRPGRQRGRPSAVVMDSIRRFQSAIPAVAEEEPHRTRIYPARPLEAKPMTAEEALMVLVDGNREYVSYRDADTGRINVLVQLRDGTAELVEGG